MELKDRISHFRVEQIEVFALERAIKSLESAIRIFQI